MQYKDYTMINQLGEGGNAKVFLVEDLSHNKYAIKELVNKTREKKQRFLNEISII